MVLLNKKGRTASNTVPLQASENAFRHLSAAMKGHILHTKGFT
jgi:hypothetical protein